MITAEPGTYSTINGLKTFWIKKGTGHPLVMVHGGSPGACARVNWGANVDFFASAGFTVYAYDQPGYGRTEALARQHAEFTGSYEPSLENCWALTRGTLYNQECVTEDLVRERYEMSTGKNFDTQQLRKGVPAPPLVYEDLKNLRIPVLLLWGANDTGVALERSLLLFQQIPGAELHIFDHCAHWVQWDQADRFNTIVRDFLTA